MATTKKAAPKKPKAAPAKKAPVKKTSEKVCSTGTCSLMGKSCPLKNVSVLQGIALFLFAVLLGNISAGVFFPAPKDILSARNLSKGIQVKLNSASEFMSYNGKTWIPVEGNPIELIVLNDKTCGASCDASQNINSLRQGITPALLVRTVDVADKEGQKLVEKFDIKGIPSFIFGDGAKSFERDGEKFVEKAKEVLTEKSGKYLLDSSKTGFKYGKFLNGPDFDIANEPTLGDGTVTVVEFADFQCPFCKRLHDQNKDLINRLVEEGKIKYVIKDFPLGFHPEANIMQGIGNCIVQNEGNDTFFKYKDIVFANQQEWSGNEDAKYLGLKYAEKAGASADNLLSCSQSAETLAEIQADMAEGTQYGVSGTPALFIGTQIMPGAIGPETFEAAVKAELGEAVETEESAE